MDHKPIATQAQQLIGRSDTPRHFVEANVTHLTQADAGHLAEFVPRYFPAQASHKLTVDPIDVLACDPDALRLDVTPNGLGWALDCWLIPFSTLHKETIHNV